MNHMDSDDYISLAARIFRDSRTSNLARKEAREQCSHSWKLAHGGTLYRFDDGSMLSVTGDGVMIEA